MRFQILACAVALLAASGAGALAIDVDPSKQTTPRKFFDPGGKGMNLFAGDPKRVDKANTIFRKDFDVTVWIEPSPVLVPAGANEALPLVRAGLLVKNIAKRPKTLSFTNSQRVDILVRSAAGQELYRWSADKQFVQAEGTSIVMPQEKVAFMVDIPLSGWSARPVPGQTYAFSGVLANYPEFTAETNVAVVVGTPTVVAPTVVQNAAPARDVLPMMPPPGAEGMSPGLGLAPSSPPDAGPVPGLSLGTGGEGGPGPASGGLGMDPLPLPVPKR